MNSKFLNLATTLTLSMALGACEISVKEDIYLDNSPASFNGNWMGACSSVETSFNRLGLFNKNSALSALSTLSETTNSRHSISVLGDSFTYKISSFSDSRCLDAQFTLAVNATYSLESTLYSSSLHEVDLRYTDITIKPESAAVAETFNSVAFCGSETWRAGVSKDVAGRTCAGTRLDYVGDRFYSLLRLNRDVLYFDISNKSRTYSGRPSNEGSRMFNRY